MVTKKRNFGDEVLFVTLRSQEWNFRSDGRPTLEAFIYKGKIKGILEMENGSISYVINGTRFNLYRSTPMSDHLTEIHQIPSSLCFDNKEDLLKEVRKILT